MVPADRVYIDGVVESYWLRHNEGQRWCYLADQRDDEAILFRSSDSAGGMAGESSCHNCVCWGKGVGIKREGAREGLLMIAFGNQFRMRVSITRCARMVRMRERAWS